MAKNALKPVPSGISLGDIVYVLFKHKWTILLCTTLAAGAAAAYYLKAGVPYESQAKLMVRYVVERSPLDRVDSTTNNNSGGEIASVIQTEMAIFTSWDLAEKVAEQLAAAEPDASAPAADARADPAAKEGNTAKESSPKSEDSSKITYRQLMGPGVDGEAGKAAAASAILQGLTVTAEKGSTVINVSFRHSDPLLPRRVLDAYVRLYLTKHLEIHRSRDTKQMADNVKHTATMELTQKGDELKKKLDEYGIISLAEGTQRSNLELTTARTDLSKAESQLEEQTARVREFERIMGLEPAAPATAPASPASSTGSPDNTAPPAPPTPSSPASPVASTPSVNANAAVPDNAAAAPPAAASAGVATATASPPAPPPAAAMLPPDSALLDDYRAIYSRLNQARNNHDLLRLKYKSDHPEVRSMQSQIDDLVRQRTAMEKKHPELLATTAASVPTAAGPRFDLPSERAELSALVARVAQLKKNLVIAEQNAKKFAADAQTIGDLQRAKELADENYKYFVTSSQKAQADSLLDNKNIPNISTLQSPTPVSKNLKARNQIILGMLFGGPVAGVGLVLLFGMFLNRSIKRPLELEESMNLPLMFSIPYFSRRKRLQASRPMGASRSTKLLKESESDKAPWEQNHFIHPFAEALRDRLTAYFEATANARKPKLIAVTGYSVGAGTSTLAGGLAASLSEIGDGKVLLVDMSGNQGAAHPFFDGRPAVSLTKALRPGAAGSLPAPEAGETANLFLARADAPSSGAATIGLRRMMPQLKASDYDYIVFDMPPLGQTKPTATMAGFMDKVIVIVEAEANSRSDVQRGYRDLTDAGADVSLIFNKARYHGPRALVGSI